VAVKALELSRKIQTKTKTKKPAQMSTTTLSDSSPLVGSSQNGDNILVPLTDEKVPLEPSGAGGVITTAGASINKKRIILIIVGIIVIFSTVALVAVLAYGSNFRLLPKRFHSFFLPSFRPIFHLNSAPSPKPHDPPGDKQSVPIIVRTIAPPALSPSRAHFQILL